MLLPLEQLQSDLANPTSQSPESGARAARRERQGVRERGEALNARRSRATTPFDPDAALLTSVLRCSLVMAETDAQRLRCKNAKALRLTIELS
jgi:hypothetical protein